VPAESVRLQWKSTDFCTYPNIWIGKNFWDIALEDFLHLRNLTQATIRCKRKAD